MRRLAKVAGIASAIVAVDVGLIVWGLGGPAEAWATWKLDGAHVVPLMPMRTCYPAMFSQARFVSVKAGDSLESVRSRLGEPLTISWSFGESRFVWFEPKDGDWVISYAHDVDVAKGTSMAAVRERWPSHASEGWEYSRSCVRDDSRRMRSVSSENGRVTGRYAGIWYD